MNHRFVVAAALALNCGGNHSSFTPGITGVSPTVITGPVSDLEIDGARFETGVTIFWNGHALPTTFENTELLSVQLDPALLVAGQARITVQNPAGLVSEPFMIHVDVPLVRITSLSPQTAPVGSADFTLTVNGVTFTAASRVRWNGSYLATQAVSDKVLTAQVTASLLANGGSGIVKVDDGGSLSLPAVFDIGPSALRTMQESTADLAWDSAHGVIVAASITSKSVVVVDPASATVVTRADAQVQNVSVSATGKYVYAGMGYAFARFDLPGLTNRVVTSLPAPAGADRVAASPKDDLTLALLSSGLWVYSSGLLPHFISPSVAGLYSTFPVVWGADDTSLYIARSEEVERYAVDAQGIVNPDALGASLGPIRRWFHFEPSNGFVYTDDGAEMRPGGESFPFPNEYFKDCVVTTDGPGVNKVFFACSDHGLNFVHAYDLASSHASLGMLSLGVADGPSRIIRWGSDGLAIATGKSIILYQGGFVR